jgi:hypothetical protein
MARKPTTFMERLEAAKDVVALYNHAQEVRAVLGSLPKFALHESGMRDGLDDAARRLFQEILLQSKPETAENYGLIFDITDIHWSERLKVLRSVADPVATAHERLLFDRPLCRTHGSLEARRFTLRRMCWGWE